MKIIVVAHGQFASGTLTSVKLIAGEIENIEAVDFVEGMSAQQLKEKMTRAIESEQHVIILSDLLGGTPFKTAVALMVERPQQDIATVSGLNLAMLLETNFARTLYAPKELAEQLINVGKDGIVNAHQLLNTHTAEEERFEDGI